MGSVTVQLVSSLTGLNSVALLGKLSIPITVGMSPV